MGYLETKPRKKSAQQIFASSKSKIETLEKGLKYVQS